MRPHRHAEPARRHDAPGRQEGPAGRGTRRRCRPASAWKRATRACATCWAAAPAEPRCRRPGRRSRRYLRHPGRACLRTLVGVLRWPQPSAARALPASTAKDSADEISMTFVAQAAKPAGRDPRGRATEHALSASAERKAAPKWERAGYVELASRNAHEHAGLELTAASAKAGEALRVMLDLAVRSRGGALRYHHPRWFRVVFDCRLARGQYRRLQHCRHALGAITWRGQVLAGAAGAASPEVAIDGGAGQPAQACGDGRTGHHHARWSAGCRRGTPCRRRTPVMPTRRLGASPALQFIQQVRDEVQPATLAIGGGRRRA